MILEALGGPPEALECDSGGLRVDSGTKLENKNTCAQHGIRPQGSIDGGGSEMCCECFRFHRVSNLGVDSKKTLNTKTRVRNMGFAPGGR